MQSFGALFTDNRALAIGLIAVAALVGVVILVLLYRLLFGRRLRMAGGRPRQPRLGVVDAFDLDRQRQLVLIRRDNVEHLIMIGGPNDIVVESAFVRMQPSASLPFARDKEAGGAPAAPIALTPGSPAGTAAEPERALPAPPAPPSSVPAPLELTEPVPTGAGPLADIPAPQPVSPPPETAAPVTPIAAPDEGAAAEPPKRPATAASRFASSFPPRQLASGSASLQRTPVSALRAPGTPPRATTGPRPVSATPLARGTSAASLRREPPPPITTPPPNGAAPPPDAAPADTAVPRPPVDAERIEAAGSPAAVAAPPAPPAAKAEEPTLPTTLDTLESLEEEMAKLLGRQSGGAGKG